MNLIKAISDIRTIKKQRAFVWKWDDKKEAWYRDYASLDQESSLQILGKDKQKGCGKVFHIDSDDYHTDNGWTIIDRKCGETFDEEGTHLCDECLMKEEAE